MALIWVFRRYFSPLASVGLAYSLAVATHYALNKWWVFGCGKKPDLRELMAYVATVLLCLICTLTCVELSLLFLTANVFKAKLIAALPTMILGYCAMRIMVFGTTGRTNPGMQDLSTNVPGAEGESNT